MSGGSVLAAARVGDRISHWVKMSDHDGALLSVVTSALVAAVGEGGATIVSIGAGIACGNGSVSVRDVVPRTVSGKVTDGSPRTLIGPSNLALALTAAQPLDCHHHRDKPIRTGAATVFSDGKGLSRRGDETHCGATLCDGDETVLVGGPPTDAAPPDPMVLVKQGAAVASAGLGAALAKGTVVIETALAWGEAIAGEVEAEIEHVEAGAEAAAGAIAAQAGALLGEATSTIGTLGSLLGAKI